MNPILDQLLVGALILAALAFFVFRNQKGCGAGCDCGGAKPKKPERKKKGLAPRPIRPKLRKTP